MIIIPLRCRRCNWETEIRSDEPMPLCGYCNSGRMGPNGPCRPAEPVEGPTKPIYRVEELPAPTETAI